MTATSTCREPYPTDDMTRCFLGAPHTGLPHMDPWGDRWWSPKPADSPNQENRDGENA